MNKITRKNAFRLVESARELMKKEINISAYLEEMAEVNIELDEAEVELQGVSNGFLAEIVHAITGYQVEVMGEAEELFACPCCGFKTLTERYDSAAATGYDICPYCKWEDDGTTDISCYRSINRGSIEDYRNKIRDNFNKYYIDKWFKE